MPHGIDRERASYIMQRLGLDALCLGRKENVRYATGAVPASTELGLYGMTFAVVPADPNIPVGLVCSQFSYYFSVSDVGLAEGAAPFQVADFFVDGRPELVMFPQAGGVSYSAKEMNRRTQTLAPGVLYTDTAKALTAALGPAFPVISRIGYDDIEAMRLVAKTFPQAYIADGSEAILHMRLVKTAKEIEAMSLAAQRNRDASLMAAKQFHNFETIADLRRSFFAITSSLGNDPAFMAVDGSLAQQFEDPLPQAGSAMLIDGVSSAYGYHGDYGRTVFIGEPRQEIATIARNVARSWEELRAELRPGLRFSQVHQRGVEILAGLSPGAAVAFGPHSVGLAHTEQPKRDLDGKPWDVLLEPGMIISVDCPLMQSYSGDTVHLEDLMLITEDGARPIHDVDQPIVIV